MAAAAAAGGKADSLPSKDERMKIENESIARYVVSRIIFSIVYIIIRTYWLAVSSVKET
jgi:hypothetical protein